MKGFFVLLFGLVLHLYTFEVAAAVQHSEDHFSVSDPCFQTLGLPGSFSSDESVQVSTHKLKKNSRTDFAIFNSRVQFIPVDTHLNQVCFDQKAGHSLRHKICVLRL